MRHTFSASSSIWASTRGSASITVVFTALLLCVAACDCDDDLGTDPPRFPDPVDSGMDGRPDMGTGPGGPGCNVGTPTVFCEGNTAVSCDAAGNRTSMTDCSSTGGTCMAGQGCSACVAGSRSCQGGNVAVCRNDGSGYDVAEMCTAGNTCSDGVCLSLCQQAEVTNSYIGCQYWPTITSNAELNIGGSQFGVVVANPQTIEASITVTRAGAMVASQTIPAGAVQTIPLPWINELRGQSGSAASVLLRGGAYKLDSTVPVTVYQLNPIDYIQSTCAAPIPPGQPGWIECYTFTNDASLLLPTHVLTGNYTILTRPAMGFNNGNVASPGFFTIVGADSGPVNVEVLLTAPTQASADGAVGMIPAGMTGAWQLMPGDALQLVTRNFGSGDCGPRSGGFCEYNGSDFTGSVIRADGKIAVVAGHNCTNIPFDKTACDHIEEAMFPEDAWGQDFIVSQTQQVRDEPNIIKIVSGVDGNSVTFTPAVNPPVTLNRGDKIEFQSTQDFRVAGTGALSVGQFMVGQNFSSAAQMSDIGDPAFLLAIPTAQFRTSYAFLAPASYVQNYVNVTAPVGGSVMLDGAPVAGFQPVAGTEMQVARVEITGGQHIITGDQPFGIVVYGRGSFTSYMYPGGLDLTAINEPPPTLE